MSSTPPAEGLLAALAGFAGVVGAGARAAVLAALMTLWTVAFPIPNWPAICESDAPPACKSTILA